MDTLTILMYQETIPYVGILIRLLTTVHRLMSNLRNHEESTERKDKTHSTQKRGPKTRKRGKSKKRKTNLRWHYRYKAKQSQDERNKNCGPPTGNRYCEPTIQEKAGDTAPKISQYDGNADSEPDSEPESDIEEGPLESIQASKCGWHKIKTKKYPKGISFWSDPDKPHDEIIAVAPTGNTTQIHKGQ